MLRWGIVFLLLAAVAWLLGFYALAGAAAFAARVVLAFFLVSALVFLMLAAASTRSVGD